MATEEKAQIAIRLPGTLLARLDTYKDRVKSGLPGMEFTRADAVRVLLEQALTEQGLPAEGAKPETKGRRRSA